MCLIKKILIISPYFPPTNAADMQRIRMSLPYFKEFGWHAEVVTVDPKFSDLIKDPLLNQSIEPGIKIHYVKALPKSLTSRIGLGSIALRALWFYRKKINEILKNNKFDLIYFSTTQFPVCILGPYWKQRFAIPFVIDMQDPWYSTYYEDKPKHERPPKYWLSSRLNKLLEPVAMKQVDGLISVSEAYINQLKKRYKELSNKPVKVLPFAYFERDFQIAKKNTANIKLAYTKVPGLVNLVYVGRGGFDMIPAIKLLFNAFKTLLTQDYESAKAIRFHFIGTSYAPPGCGRPSFKPLAEELDISRYVEENPDRISYYESIKALQNADGIIIPGSNDPGYTASKLYPYILSEKPLIGIFQPSSSAYTILSASGSGMVANLNEEENALKEIQEYIIKIINRTFDVSPNWSYMEAYSARSMTEKQCALFNKVIC